MRVSFFSLAILILFTLPITSRAEEATTTTATSTDSGNFFEEIIQNVTGAGDTTTQETPSQAVLSPTTEKRLINLAANISNRLDGLNMRLRQIAGRVDQRIEKQAEAGYNVDAARASLQTAYAELDAASKELKHIDQDVYRTFRSLNPKEGWREVRATYLRARDNIQAAHRQLKTSVALLKAATPATAAATSTATTTQQ